MLTEPFAIAYADQRLRTSVGGHPRKTDTIEAIVSALTSTGWTLEERLAASARFAVWYPWWFTTAPAVPPPAIKAKIYASKYGAFGFYNPYSHPQLPLARISFYDPYREDPQPAPNLTWIPMADIGHEADAMEDLREAVEAIFAPYCGTCTIVNNNPYDFQIDIPSAGTDWNDANIYVRPAHSTVGYWNWGSGDYQGVTMQGNFKYGGYKLRSAAQARCGRCRLIIYEPDSGYSWWTGIKLIPGTDAGHFWIDSPDFTIDHDGVMDIVATPHSLVLFSPTNEERGAGMNHGGGRLNLLFGAVYVPDSPGWPSEPGSHLYASTTSSLDDGKFRLSARPRTLISYDGGTWRWGDFGVLGPTYEVDAPLVYRRGRKPLISNAMVSMADDAAKEDVGRPGHLEAGGIPV